MTEIMKGQGQLEVEIGENTNVIQILQQGQQEIKGELGAVKEELTETQREMKRVKDELHKV